MLIARMLIAVTGSGMALVLLVVMLLYGVYLDTKPELAQEFGSLIWTTVVFAVIGGSATAASFARVRRWSGAGWWDGLLLVSLPLGVMLLLQIYG